MADAYARSQDIREARQEGYRDGRATAEQEYVDRIVRLESALDEEKKERELLNLDIKVLRRRAENAEAVLREAARAMSEALDGPKNPSENELDELGRWEAM